MFYPSNMLGRRGGCPCLPESDGRLVRFAVVALSTQHVEFTLSEIMFRLGGNVPLFVMSS